MTNQHPITPPPELLDQWCMENNWRDIAIQAAQWGADQELEACFEWLDTEKILTKDGGYIRKLRDARRPKPPSLKEQAFAVLDHTQKGYGLAEVDLDTIRRALEALDD
jgi:hypothetical protein